MKIMTRDGRDVTNSASRGSKTKEQRDHAHLMRIIKACESCRKKKIRCDPSHKKRGVAQATSPQSAATAKSQTKKPRTSPVPPPTGPRSVSPMSISPASVSPPPVAQEDMPVTASPFDFDASNLSFDGFDAFASTADAGSLWDEFVQYPPMDLGDDYDFLADPESYLSSQPSEPATRVDGLASQARPETAHDRRLDVRSGESRTADSPQLPYLDQSGSSSDYTDFNLFSPGSTFSEDDRMLQVSSSSSTLSSVNEQQDSDRVPVTDMLDRGKAFDVGNKPDHDHITDQRYITDQHQQSLYDRRDRDQVAPGLDAETAAGIVNSVNRSDITMTTNEQGQLVICCPPGTVVVTNRGSTGGDQQDVSPHSANLHFSSFRLTPRKATPSTDLRSSAFTTTDLSVRTPSEHRRRPRASAANPSQESAVAGVPAEATDVEHSVDSWLDQRHDSPLQQQDILRTTSGAYSMADGSDGLDVYQTSRFVHRNTDSVRRTMMDMLVPESPGSSVTRDISDLSAASAGVLSASTSSSPVSSFGSYSSDQAGERQDGRDLGVQLGASVMLAGESVRSEVSAQGVSSVRASSVSAVGVSSSFADDSRGVDNTEATISSHKDVTGIGRAAEKSESSQVEPAVLATMMQSVIMQVMAAAACVMECSTSGVASGTVTRSSARSVRAVRAVRACREVGQFTSPLSLGRGVVC
jgi:hypothetical protein